MLQNDPANLHEKEASHRVERASPALASATLGARTKHQDQEHTTQQVHLRGDFVPTGRRPVPRTGLNAHTRPASRVAGKL